MYKTTIFAEGVASIQKYLSERGNSTRTFEKYLEACKSLEAFFFLENIQHYETDANKRYRIHVDTLVKKGEISERQGRNYRRFSLMMDDFYHDRPFQERYHTGKQYKYRLSEDSSQWVDKFLKSLTLAESTIPSAGTIARSFFYFLEQNNLAVETMMTEKNLVNFLNFKHTENKNSMEFVLYLFRKLLQFLKASGVPINGMELVSYKAAAARRKVLPAIDSCDMELLLKYPDRETSIGKRNYAILLLASCSGMRCMDLANLKQEQINRREKSIVLVQHKTNQPLSLPVNQETLDALDDYLTHARPNSSLPYVFLTIFAPYRKLQSQSIQAMFIRNLRAAGIEKKAYDGKSFHAFRRTIGKWLLESDANTEMISQVLGHRNQNVLQRYLPLASDILRECALDFTYAPVTTEVYK